MAMIPYVKPVPLLVTMSSKLSQSQLCAPIDSQFERREQHQEKNTHVAMPPMTSRTMEYASSDVGGGAAFSSSRQAIDPIRPIAPMVGET